MSVILSWHHLALQEHMRGKETLGKAELMEIAEASRLCAKSLYCKALCRLPLVA